jgi:hypothetical protein
MPVIETPRAEFHPRKLTPEEIKKPIGVINSFFDFANLPQARDLMDEWIKTTVTGSFNHELTRRERTSLYYFFGQVQRLIEACHLLHSQRKYPARRRSIPKQK